MIYLASASPRRQALLRQLGVEFSVLVPRLNETRGSKETPPAYVRRLAHAKALAAWTEIGARGLAPHPVLAADTCVVLAGEVLGKPRDRADGEAMLRRLSGREHQVLTAVAVLHSGAAHDALSTSHVRFRALSEPEIARYWDTGEPADKAGAYALQGRAAAFVEHITGSYSGIVGLPLYEVWQLLRRVGVDGL